MQATLPAAGSTAVCKQFCCWQAVDTGCRKHNRVLAALASASDTGPLLPILAQSQLHKVVMRPQYCRGMCCTACTKYAPVLQ